MLQVNVSPGVDATSLPASFRGQSGPAGEQPLSGMRSQHHEARDAVASALYLCIFPCLLFGDDFWRGWGWVKG